MPLRPRSSLYKSRKDPTILAMQPPRCKHMQGTGNIGGVLSLPREFLEGFTEEGTFGPRVKRAEIFQKDKCVNSVISRGSSMYRICSEN